MRPGRPFVDREEMCANNRTIAVCSSDDWNIPPEDYSISWENEEEPATSKGQRKWAAKDRTAAVNSAAVPSHAPDLTAPAQATPPVSNLKAVHVDPAATTQSALQNTKPNAPKTMTTTGVPFVPPHRRPSFILRNKRADNTDSGVVSPHLGNKSGDKTASGFVPPHQREKTGDNTGSCFIPPHQRGKSNGNTKQPVQANSAQPVQNGHAPTNGAPKAPFSPPTSPRDKHDQKVAEKKGNPGAKGLDPAELGDNWKEEFRRAGIRGWGASEPDEPPAPQPPTQPKGRRNNRKPSPAKRKSHWQKVKEYVPPPEVEGDNGGWSYKSESNSEFYDIKKLIDFEGNWAPPPCWGDRVPFEDRHFRENIEKWMNGHDDITIKNINYRLTPSDFRGIPIDGERVFIGNRDVAPKTVNKTVVPEYWIPEEIDGEAPSDFWRALLHRAPAALSDIDVTEFRPFWDECPEKGIFIKSPQPPEEGGLDLSMIDNRVPGVKFSTDEYLDDLANKKLARERRHKAKRDKRMAAMPVRPVPEPIIIKGFQPTANVYFRPVKAADASSICELYNTYITQTIHVPEFKERTLDQIVERINMITNQNLPYLVAVDKSNNRRPVGQKFVSERIVAIAFMDDFCDLGSMYRFAFELEMYVHRDFMRKGLAKCMLDRLIELINPSYTARGGYDWVNNGQYLKNGAGRVIKTVNISVPHLEGDNLEWMTEFLKKFKFRKVGHMFKMGYKYGKTVDLTIYQHETTELIPADAVPARPL